jgi:hypothetical protein
MTKQLLHKQIILFLLNTLYSNTILWSIHEFFFFLTLSTKTTAAASTSSALKCRSHHITVSGTTFDEHGMEGEVQLQVSSNDTTFVKLKLHWDLYDGSQETKEEEYAKKKAEEGKDCNTIKKKMSQSASHHDVLREFDQLLSDLIKKYTLPKYSTTALIHGLKCSTIQQGKVEIRMETIKFACHSVFLAKPKLKCIPELLGG